MTAAMALLPQEPKSVSPLSELDADLVFTATVRFDSLTVERTGAPTVEFSGALLDRTEWTVERINLPATLEPGVTYRNGGIRLRVLATFKTAEAFLQALDALKAQAAAAKPQNDRIKNKKPPEKRRHD
ncbi:MAG: hypothetical protein WD690_09910 [Vicinamibacterales bacterium]